MFKEFVLSLSDRFIANLILLLPLACLSLILFLGYKSVCISYSKPKHAKTSYKEVLWIRILAKSTIFVPFMFWFLDIIIFRFFPIHRYIGFLISWNICCLLLLFFRRIHKKIRNNNSPKLPSPFYNKKRLPKESKKKIKTMTISIL